VGIVITTDDEVQALNRQYLGHDYRTDVLSFGMMARASS
jgi:ssRNA-specific RNase YbeY (16S rRNA maturation enzyme)